MKAARPFRERAAARSHEPAVALDDFRSVAPLALAGVRIVPDAELAGETATTRSLHARFARTRGTASCVAVPGEG